VEDSSLLPLIFYYKKINYQTFGISEKNFPIGFFSKFLDRKILMPPFKLEDRKKVWNFIKYLKSVCGKYNIKLLLSFEESKTKHIIFFKKRLKIRDIFPPYSSFKILYYKDLTKEKINEIIKPRSFLLPKTFTYPHIKFPCIVKPNAGSCGRHISICNNFIQLKRNITKIKVIKRRPIIEEYIPFQNKITLNLLIDRKFKIKRCVVRKVVSEEKITEILYELEEFFKRIKFFGFASPQFILQNNNLYLTEINPRLSTVPLGINFGAEFPEAFHKSIVERKNVEERIVFLPKYYPQPQRDIVNYVHIYKREYKDILPALATICQYFTERIKHHIKYKFSNEYKMWYNVIWGQYLKKENKF
jgi:hypothetical protein